MINKLESGIENNGRLPWQKRSNQKIDNNQCSSYYNALLKCQPIKTNQVVYQGNTKVNSACATQVSSFLTAEDVESAPLQSRSIILCVYLFNKRPLKGQ
ncbi:hypothetical protein TNIN_361991 [Trichonephila inaurata madagascariensis]|uniref:Uncharacterized protein n=1 Tax=Trichonephila inaurata madagascariensis TaxID=2747483 RepID=A0A8X6XIK4_9ARAC|nr:hypothetical protein TNIN_361991 [Trichonephila inaurata madagascariensis]